MIVMYTIKRTEHRLRLPSTMYTPYSVDRQITIQHIISETVVSFVLVIFAYPFIYRYCFRCTRARDDVRTNVRQRGDIVKNHAYVRYYHQWYFVYSQMNTTKIEFCHECNTTAQQQYNSLLSRGPPRPGRRRRARGISGPYIIIIIIMSRDYGLVRRCPPTSDVVAVIKHFFFFFMKCPISYSARNTDNNVCVVRRYCVRVVPREVIL